ncbi:MAG: F0F1 ATP synthase subunit A [bacterium]|nr:F0F1 ATP synthase subunit A [bacterium]
MQLVIIVLLILFYKWAKHKKFGLLLELFVEKVYEFFEEILEETGKRWIKVYVVTLFFVILISNLSSWFLDVVRIIFVDVDGLGHFIQIPTTSFEFNIALALVSVLLSLIAQFKFL